MANMVMEKILLEQNVGKEITQVLMEGDIIVSDVKPDMSVILQTDARSCIDRTEVSTDRVNFIGRLDLHVLYLAKGANKTVHSMGLTATIDDFINIDGVNKDMWVDARAEITNIDYKMLNDRKLNYRAVVTVFISAERSESRDVIVHVSDVPENQLLKTNLSLNRSIECKTERFTVSERLTVPSGKPNIREILQATAIVGSKDARIGNGKVSLTGELALTTLFRGDSGDSLIEFMENELPINTSIEISGAREGMFADVTLNIAEQNYRVLQDDDGEDRVIEAEVTVCAILKVHCQEAIEILEDAYDINKTLDISKSSVRYPKLICRNKNQSPIKEIVQLGDDCPDILQIFKVTGSAHLDETKIIDDKVIAEGYVSANVLYVAESDETPLYSYSDIIPYRQFIETKGANSDMTANIDISIDHIGFNMLSGRELEVKFLLSFNTQVVQECEINVITGMEFSDMDKAELDSMASMTVYAVQPGDSLWKIAKRYNTSIDELLTVNEIDNSNRIYPGQKLLILKKIL
jgi:hypothetical protein